MRRALYPLAVPLLLTTPSDIVIWNSHVLLQRIILPSSATVEYSEGDRKSVCVQFSLFNKSGSDRCTLICDLGGAGSYSAVAVSRIEAKDYAEV